jgi:hypothetical protein
MDGAHCVVGTAVGEIVIEAFVVVLVLDGNEIEGVYAGGSCMRWCFDFGSCAYDAARDTSAERDSNAVWLRFMVFLVKRHALSLIFGVSRLRVRWKC